MNSIALKDVLASPRLPSLPTVAVKLLRLVQDPDVTLNEVAETLTLDPVLAGKILRTANSPLYGQARTVSSLQAAVRLLGLRTVKALALGFSIVDDLKTPEQGGFDYTEFWDRSLYAANGARILAARRRTQEAEEAFLGGLLHEIGILACAAVLGTAYSEAYASLPNHARSELLAREREQFGFDHRDVAAGIARLWGLPLMLSACLEHSHDADAAPLESRALVQDVAIGALAATVFLANDKLAALEMYRGACSRSLGLETGEADEILRQMDVAKQTMRSLLEMPSTSTLSAGEILADANEALVQLSLQSESNTLQLERERQQLSAEARTDALTGLDNRREFDRALVRETHLARRHDYPVSIAICDLDHFKRVNDTFGHQAGDAVLRSIAEALRGCARIGDLVARYGGEEFVFIMPHASTAGAAALAERIRAEVENLRVVAGGSQIRVTISVGLATFDPAGGLEPGQVLAAADAALYRAKAEGRNRVCWAQNADYPKNHRPAV